jgi:hypothetical protein
VIAVFKYGCRSVDRTHISVSFLAKVNSITYLEAMYMSWHRQR